MSKASTKSKPAKPAVLDIDDELEERDDQIIARAFRWSLSVIVVAGAAIGGGLWWYNRAPAVVEKAPEQVREIVARQKPLAAPPTVKFTDITADAGITFVHQSGSYGEKLLPETMGGGCAFFDYDGDGDPDLLFINSNYWPDRAPEGAPPPTMALYRNDGHGKFTDVTAEAGLAATFYGMGCAVGDYDNDGWVDLYISAVGSNHLYHNDHGKFRDVTDEAGVAGAASDWSTGCGFVDYDNDGDLDLFVCNYVKWSKEIDLAQDFRLVGVGRAYGPPVAFEGSYPLLFRNDGHGKFTDVSATAGIQVNNPNTGVPAGKSLGLAPVDLDGDGWIDFVVANDTVQNFVFINQHDGTFRERGAEIGIAFDPSGNARGAMGTHAAWFRNDDTLGVAIGNFANEMVSLYVSQGPRAKLQFADEANANGLGPASRLLLKFGLFFFDYDLDSRLDVLTANGHLEQEISKVQASQQYEQPPQLFWNCGRKERTEFVAASAQQCGDDFVKPMVGRGAAYADIDGDGDLDVVLTAVGGAPRLLRNDQALGNHWLRLKLVGRTVNRDAIGALVEVKLGDQTLRQQVMPTCSYVSQVELPVTFGLGKNEKVDSVKIVWPGGQEQVVENVAIDKLTTVEQASP